MTALTIKTRTEPNRTVFEANAWSLSVWQDADDDLPRMRDLDVAERLGYARPREIRKLIERVWPEGQRPIRRASVALQSVGRAGRGTRRYTADDYWLTEAQILKLCARSSTPVAEAILDEMIAVYLAVREARLPTTLALSQREDFDQQTDEAIRSASYDSYLAGMREAFAQLIKRKKQELSSAFHVFNGDHHARRRQITEKLIGMPDAAIPDARVTVGFDPFDVAQKRRKIAHQLDAALEIASVARTASAVIVNELRRTPFKSCWERDAFGMQSLLRRAVNDRFPRSALPAASRDAIYLVFDRDPWSLVMEFEGSPNEKLFAEFHERAIAAPLIIENAVGIIRLHADLLELHAELDGLDKHDKPESSDLAL